MPTKNRPSESNETIEYVILAFRCSRELEAFWKAATQSGQTAIKCRSLSGNVLLVAKGSHVTPEEWGKFRGMGFQSVCGAKWISVWHETLDLQNDLASKLIASDIPFVEEFSGGECRVMRASLS